YPAKIPHFFESLKILAFYAILPSTPLIACESFVQALLSGFERLCVAWHDSRIDGLNGLRPDAPRRCPPFKSSTAFRALTPAGHFSLGRVASLRLRPEYGTPYFVSLKANFKIFTKASRRFSLSE